MDHIWAAAHRPKKSPGLLILEQLGHYFRSVIMEDPVVQSQQQWLSGSINYYEVYKFTILMPKCHLKYSRAICEVLKECGIE